MNSLNDRGIEGEKQIIEQLIKKTDEIPGWLAPEATCFTAYLLSHQKTINLTGNIVEIGVYKGKYLAVLYNYLNTEDERVIGIDAFIGATNTEHAKKQVFSNILKAFGKNRQLDILINNSLDLTPEMLLQLIHGQNARLISIDGGHTVDVVCHDLHLSTAILKDGGVIIMDDIFNHSLPGVTEGLFKFMFEENSKTLAPFVHCYNKLFLTTPDYYERYYRHSLEILEKMKDYSAYQRTKTRINENYSLNFVPQLFGYEVLCFL